MWFLLLYLQISAIQGQGFKVALRGSSSPCRGRLEVRDANGQWGLVCHHGWKVENGQVVCRSLKCGNVKHSNYEITRYLDRLPPPPKLYLMDQVNCKSNETSLWECPFYGPENIKCKEGFSSFVAVECTGNVELRLSGHRDKCAGLVEYTTQDGTFGVCKDSNWNKKKADRICKELECGDCYREYETKTGLVKGQQTEENVSHKCEDKEQFSFSWQCMELSKCSERVSVICNKHRRFRLQGGDNLCSGFVEQRNVTVTGEWVPVQKEEFTPEDICTQLNCGTNGSFTIDNGKKLRLTCSGNVKLRNFTSKCFGEVNINVNGSDYGVCYSDSNKKLGEQVCKELGCGRFLKDKAGRDISNGLLSNVECLGDEASLWHCLARHEIKQCKATTVICAGSLDVRLRNGPGLRECSGRVEVRWEGSWESINFKEWTTVESDMVCKHLKCGKSTSKPKLFNGEIQNQLEWPWHFKCENPSAKLDDCIKTETKPSSSSGGNVVIMCQKEELMFFEGDSPCKGRVLIKSFDGVAEVRPVPEKLMELRTEDKTEAFNNTEAYNTTEANNNTEAYDKKKVNNSICHAMECGGVFNFTKQNGTYANVTCLGSVSVTLQNQLEKDEKCWGTVEVCKNGACGGVCRDTWTTEDSTKICDNLGCGKPITIPIQTQYRGSVKYYSVFCLNEVKNISMCRFTPMMDYICKNPAQVICTGSVKAKLEDPRDKCAGTVTLSYVGKFTPVCKDSLNEDLNNAICRELKCGKFKPTNKLTLRDEFQDTGLSGVQCNSDANNISQCNLEIISDKNKCIPGYLQCTEQRRLLLYEQKGSCSGPVYALSGEKTQLVSAQGWGKEEVQKMCEYLKCGDYESHSNITRDMKEWWNKTYNCSGKKDIWDCESDQASKLPEQLNITCDDKHPPIVLSKNCTGEVSINKENVCASHLEAQMYSELCDSLGCGTAFDHWNTNLQKKNCWHFSCTGKETQLWQCGFTKGSCNNLLSVACQKGIEFGSTEKCGGKLIVKYRGQWEYVCKDIFPDTEVCKVLNCMNGQQLVDKKDISKEDKVIIKCPKNYQHIYQCVQLLNQKCNSGPAEIKCEGYEEIVKSGNAGLIVGLSLGLLGLLIMVFMWINRKRLLLVLRNYRNKNGKDINIDRNEMNNMKKEDRDLSHGKASALDYDDYEDVDSVTKTGEEDADDRSEGSSGTEYDDIEGQNSDVSPHQTHAEDDLPLLPKRPDNSLADQDTYEVETEEQEDYDDVMPLENAGMADAQVDVAVDAGTDSEAGTGVNADAEVVTTEVVVHAEQEE